MKSFENSISSVIHFISVKNILKLLGSLGLVITVILCYVKRRSSNLVHSKVGSSIKVLRPI